MHWITLNNHLLLITAVWSNRSDRWLAISTQIIIIIWSIFRLILFLIVREWMNFFISDNFFFLFIASGSFSLIWWMWKLRLMCVCEGRYFQIQIVGCPFDFCLLKEFSSHLLIVIVNHHKENHTHDVCNKNN